jgi:hypothetical protein
MASDLSPSELRLLQEFAAAGHRGRIVNTGSRSGLTTIIRKRYITERVLSPYSVLYVINDRGRRALAEANVGRESEAADGATKHKQPPRQTTRQAKIGPDV